MARKAIAENKILIKCDFCGKIMEKFKSEIENRRSHCCSRQCNVNLRKKILDLFFTK